MPMSDWKCVFQNPDAIPGHLEEPELPQQLVSVAQDAYNAPQPPLTSTQDTHLPVQQQLQQLLWDVQAMAGRASARAGTSAALAKRLYGTSLMPDNAAADGTDTMKPAQRERWNRCRDLQLLASSMDSLTLTRSAA